MNNLQLTITEEGQRALFNMQQNGFKLNLTHIAVGTAIKNVVGDETSLQNEVLRTEIADSQIIDNNRIHLATNISSDDEFKIYEFGVLTDEGILFAYWSNNIFLAEKTPTVDLLISVDVILTNISTENLEITNNNQFSLPFASDVEPGIISKDEVREISNIIINNYDPIPIGTIFPYASLITPEDPKYMLAHGFELNRVVFEKLFSVIEIFFGHGDGIETFNIPDLRGLFIRGLDCERGIDIDRIMGSYQEDQLKSHYHLESLLSNLNQKNNFGYDLNYIPDYNNASEITYTSAKLTEGDELAVKTSSIGGNENRPKNISTNYIIKVM